MSDDNSAIVFLLISPQKYAVGTHDKRQHMLKLFLNYHQLLLNNSLIVLMNIAVEFVVVAVEFV